MRRLLTLLLGALAMLGLSGCDAVNMQDLKPGVSTGYDVRDKLGKPGIEWRNDDGSVTWEYTRQPEGTQCFMATIGPDNILKSLKDALTDVGLWRDDSLVCVYGGIAKRYVNPGEIPHAVIRVETIERKVS